ncbi:MAG: hypothetical protein N2114_06390 [Candidatus Goldbacteria bacterium]|nr:hypothetical protein [Candidatus Goldiibacteriota bacterium]
MKNNIIILFIVIIIITSCLPIHPPPPPVEPSLKSWNCYYGNFSNRAFHSSIHQSSSSSIYYIIGGTSDEITGLNDVWIGDISSNSLTCLTTTAGFSKRWGHTSVIFKEKIWVIGGTEDGQKGLNDVWVSENGIDWELATGSAGFSGRWGHVCRIYQTNYYDGKIWLIGGTSDGKTGLNDIWYSEDGINWTEVSISGLRFSGRWGHAITDSYSFILIGGTENGQTGLNDVWESEDGINWKLLSGNAEFEKRWGHSIVYGGKYSQYIFVANGKKITQHI